MLLLNHRSIYRTLPTSLLIAFPSDSKTLAEKMITPLEAMAHRGVAVEAIPSFKSFAEHRRWILEHLAGAFRVFGREGYAEGIAGHISVRDPEYSDRFWMNPLAVHFSMMRVSDLICLDMKGNVVDGNKVGDSTSRWRDLEAALIKYLRTVRPRQRGRCVHSYRLPPGPP